MLSQIFKIFLSLSFEKKRTRFFFEVWRKDLEKQIIQFFEEWRKKIETDVFFWAKKERDRNRFRFLRNEERDVNIFLRSFFSGMKKRDRNSLIFSRNRFLSLEIKDRARNRFFFFWGKKNKDRTRFFLLKYKGKR